MQRLSLLFASVILLASNAAHANCSQFLSDPVQTRRDVIVAYDFFAEGFTLASDVSCAVVDGEIKKRNLQPFERLTGRDCAGRERGMRYLRLGLDEKLALVDAWCREKPSQDLDRAVMTAIIELK